MMMRLLHVAKNNARATIRPAYESSPPEEDARRIQRSMHALMLFATHAPRAAGLCDERAAPKSARHTTLFRYVIVTFDARATEIIGGTAEPARSEVTARVEPPYAAPAFCAMFTPSLLAAVTPRLKWYARAYGKDALYARRVTMRRYGI